ncbi:MAG: branched-chain amino acid ABC transporter permease [Gammaproteobacteria bacterium]|nr:branched-chain amino acid ABC transporter permease [Gammaproteobacteria bacterium]MDH3370322.1 branched-chain amino acid ABC transporter permease [Gammaproteobacteria bacterium]MDH3407181.1 branched-chain amino acid ABC transporter permease [Gammaproteobacteria bacterium]MDH3562893.1 branched-chain amino acid ABC transporter permease [Gammaproteobacteria bacterium]MDH5487734.1 branched-chain amino acid ABC transporter permease [Gammaproteobacteria bacterium]
MELLEPEILLQMLINGLLAGALYALLAGGLNLIFGVMRVINIAHAEFMLIGAFGAYVLFNVFGLHPLFSLLIIVPIIFVVGYYFQRVLIERVVDRPMLTSLLATYGVSIILINVGLLIFSSDFKSVPVLQGSFLIGDLAVSKPRAVAGLVSLVLSVGVYLFLDRTRLGKAVRAVSEHAQVAQICGIDVRQIRMLTFGMAAAMAGAAGVMLSIIYSFWPGSGVDFIQKCFAIIIIGGMGNFVGALYGGILLGVVESFVGGFISTQWAEAVAYLLLVTVLLVRPTGLKGVARA